MPEGPRSAKIGGLREGDAAIATEYPGFRSRLDKLLESAIEEQEREQQGFMEVLQASRDALTAVRTELDGMRDAVEHVLSRFRPSETPLINEAVQIGAQAVIVWVEKGIDVCMNQYNG